MQYAQQKYLPADYIVVHIIPYPHRYTVTGHSGIRFCNLVADLLHSCTVTSCVEKRSYVALEKEREGLKIIINFLMVFPLGAGGDTPYP